MIVELTFTISSFFIMSLSIGGLVRRPGKCRTAFNSLRSVARFPNWKKQSGLNCSTVVRLDSLQPELSSLAKSSALFGGLKELPAHVGGHEQRLRLSAPARILRDYLPSYWAHMKTPFSDFKLNLFDSNQTIGGKSRFAKARSIWRLPNLEEDPASQFNPAA